MTVEEDVDNVILHVDCKKPIVKHEKRLKRWHWLLLCLVCSSLGAAMILLAFDKNWIESFFGASEETVSSTVGDEPPEEPEAYHYWFAPENSFGISETKTVNWSYFKQLFLAHTDWELEYKRYSYSSWTNGDQYMTIDRTWNDTGFWKFNLIFDVPVDVYSARFTFGCDLPVLQYVERSGYEVWINYTANATETYSAMFNWSDIASIPGLVITKNVTGDMFWFRFRRDNIPAGHYEFDPFFGRGGGRGSNSVTTENYIIGGYYQMGATGGTGDSITAQIYSNLADTKIKCILYNSDKTKVANGETEELTTTADGYYQPTFDFPSSPTLVADAWYYICIWSESDAGTHNAYYNTSGGNGAFFDSETYNDFPDPYNPSTLDADGALTIYCSYTEAGGNTAPTQTNPGPANASENNSITPELNITLNDADADWLNTTFLSNSSGSWVAFYTNMTAPGDLPVNIRFNNSNFSAPHTKYWWSANTTDGTDWTNATYHFTTKALNVFQWNFTISNTAITNTTFQWNFTISHTEIWKEISPMQYNFTISNTAIWNTIEQWNFTVSNTAEWKQPFQWNFTISHTETWKDIPHMQYNFSISNTAITNKTEQWNFTVSNTAAWKKPMQFNFTISHNNTWKEIPHMQYNFTISNTAIWNRTEQWNFTVSNTPLTKQPFQYNFTISNTETWKDIPHMQYNFSVSNTAITNKTFQWNFTVSNTVSWGQPMQYNFTISHTNLTRRTFQYNFSISNTAITNKTFQWNFTISNTTRHTSIPSMQFNFTISSTIPELSQSNHSIYEGSSVFYLSNTNVIFPFISFNVSITDRSGDTMNITIYTNESGSWTVVNASTGLANGTYNFTNTSWADVGGTTYYLHFNLTDGTIWDNESYYFILNSNVSASFIIRSGRSSVILSMGVVGGLLGGIIGAMIFVKRRRERNVYEK